MPKISCFIFDLDGVIVDTAKFHFISWKWVCEQLGFELTEADNEKLKGISRVQSLEILLEMGSKSISPEEKVDLLQKKNEKYLEFILKMDRSEMLPRVLGFLEELKENELKIALGSASKNAGTILKQLEIEHFFDAIVDGNSVTKSKPDPEVFLKGAELCGVTPEKCVVFEDSQAGVKAANIGNFYSVGIGDQGSLSEADIVLAGFENISLSSLNSLLS